MKVLLFTKMFPRLGNDSFGSYVYSQISQLSTLDNVDVKIISPHSYVPKFFSVLGGKFKEYATFPKVYEYKGLKVYSPSCFWSRRLIKNPQLKYFAFKLSVKKQLLNYCINFKPDILYALDPTMDGRLCVEIGEKLGIPVVIIEHSMPKFYDDLYGIGSYEKIYKSVVEYISEMIFVSQKQKTAFESTIRMKINGTVIINGFEKEPLNRRVPILCDDILHLVCIGYLEERKGYPVLFDSLKQYKEKYNSNFFLNIIGDGLDRKKYEKIVEQYDLSKNVRFLGLISHKEVISILNESDIFVLPSYGEAFGISYLEAMSCGLPIIGTINEGISDIVTDGVNGFLIKKKDVVGLCDIIYYIVQNPEKVRKIAQNGNKTVEQFSWENNAKQLVERFKNYI